MPATATQRIITAWRLGQQLSGRGAGPGRRAAQAAIRALRRNGSRRSRSGAGAITWIALIWLIARVRLSLAESLAQSASHGSTRAIELHDGKASINKLAAEPSTEGAGAFPGKKGGVAELLGPADQLVIPLVPPARWPAPR